MFIQLASQSLDAQGDFSIKKTENGKLELQQKMWSTMGGFGAVFSNMQVICTHLQSFTEFTLLYCTVLWKEANMSVLCPLWILLGCVLGPSSVDYASPVIQLTQPAGIDPSATAECLHNQVGDLKSLAIGTGM